MSVGGHQPNPFCWGKTTVLVSLTLALVAGMAMACSSGSTATTTPAPSPRPTLQSTPTTTATPNPEALDSSVLDSIEQAILEVLGREGRPFKVSAGHLASLLAQETVTYKFDRVEVKYASKFTAQPQRVKPDNWLAGLAGGVDQPIEVVYGVVSLVNEREPLSLTEGFLWVTGEQGSERFLMNSGSYVYYDDLGPRKPEEPSSPGKTPAIPTPTPTSATPASRPGVVLLKYSNTEFSSHKKLDGPNVIKDFTPPVRSIYFNRALSESQALERLVLAGFVLDGPTPGQSFWDWQPSGAKEYHADLATLVHAGDPAATP